ncbi:MAG: methyl-accepting chemotaxis protein, partial [Desulfobulbaceae bacterium]|nr:methyl-accepting chemotaxis protein [Desulfobulbaceae bacterium]
MKIGKKLAMGFGIVVFLMILLGATGIIQLNSVNNGYKVSVKKEENAKFLAQKLQSDILQVRRNEKDFLARQDMKYFKKGNGNLDLAAEDARKLMETTTEDGIRNNLGKALQGIDSYRTAFAKLAKASEERGLNEKEGLQGRFRNDAHQLSAYMDQYDTEDIRYGMLMLRRYEKDLNINRQNEAKSKKYLTKFNEALDSCLNAVKESKIEKEVQQDIQTKIEKYGKSLTAWYKGKGSYQEVRGLAGEVEKITDKHFVPDGKVILLTLRKEEKDYMLRGDEKYIQRLEKAAAKLMTNIDKSLIENEEKKALTALVEDYTIGIRLLMEKDVEIATLLTEMKQNADPVLDLTDEIVKETTSIAARISDEISSSASIAITVVWILGLASIIIAVVFAYFFGRGISIPLQKAARMLKEMGKGHLGQRLKMDRSDEIGEMAKTMDEFADNLQNEMVLALDMLAKGDLTFAANPRDDADAIRNALLKTGNDLNTLIAEILNATEQVVSGADQVSAASQALSQGATEQAASLEQITSSMTEMGSQTKLNAENASQANQLASQTRSAAEGGNAKMQEMVAAMGEINEAGQNISKIIKVIDEIAFQTNLLALNAAVEAARAGRHGKGFAVVAEEVRNLAARSAKAAKETAELIEGSVEKTKNGTAIAEATSAALAEIVTSVTKVTDLVGEIAAASNEQAQGINQTNQALGQIDQVTQQNTASAEESAAASEELSGQAMQMKEMMARFKVRDTAHSTTSRQPALPKPPQTTSQGESWGASPQPVKKKEAASPSDLISLD